MKEFPEALLMLVIGMGVVFVSVIILVGLMKIGGRLFRDKVTPKPPLEPESAPLPVSESSPSVSDSTSEATTRVETPAAVSDAVVTAPPQASVPTPEAPAAPTAVKPKASLDKKRKAAIAGVMAYLQEEAATLPQRSPSPTVSKAVPSGSSWKIAGRQLLIGSRGRPSGDRRR